MIYNFSFVVSDSGAGLKYELIFTQSPTIRITDTKTVILLLKTTILQTILLILRGCIVSASYRN